MEDLHRGDPRRREADSEADAMTTRREPCAGERDPGEQDRVDGAFRAGRDPPMHAAATPSTRAIYRRAAGRIYSGASIAGSATTAF